MRRPYKALVLTIALFMESGLLIDHLFLYLRVTLGLWYKLLKLARHNWVAPRTIGDTMVLSLNGEYY